MQELQRYSSEVNNLFTGGPKWLDFAIFSEQMVSTAINKNLEVLDKYNRHYNCKESLVHTHIILSTGWLWENGQVRPHDYTIGWELVQNLLIQKFSYYQLLFSQNAELEFCVDGFYYKECIPHFWCMINTRRNDVKNKRTTNAMEDRIIGTLMGQAVGDALGARYKFSTPNVALSGINRTNEILGGGPFKLPSGYLSITELAIYLAKTTPTPDQIVEWYNTDPPPFSDHLETIRGQIDLSDLVLGLMTPFAISDTNPITFLRVVKDPVIADMAQVFWVSLKNALAGDSRKDIWRKAILQASSELVKSLLYASTETRGDTFIQCAFYELLYGKNIQDSLKAVISLGGDTDIRGSICGALLGGLYGYSEIPSNWSKTILNCQHVRQKRFSDINTNDLISLALRLSGK